MAAELHIVVTRDGLILTRGAAATFRDFQDVYPDFMTSLGPMDRDGVLDTFQLEWPEVLVMHHDTIRTFIDAKGTDQRPEVRLLIYGGNL